MLERKPLVIFLILAFLISWSLFLVPLAFTNTDSQTQQIVTTVAFALAMWGPGIAAIVATLTTGGSFRDLNLQRLGAKRFYLWAWLLFPCLALFSGMVTVLLRLGTFDPNLTVIRETLTALPETSPLSPTAIVALQIGAALTIAPLINTLFSLGEEVGWRGFLLPRLLPLGQWKAILLSNMIWGLWHAPAIAQGLNYPGYPILGILMMIVFTVLVGTILSWLYLKTNSPWAPAFGHGVLNAVAGLPTLFLLPGFNLALGGTLASAAGWVGLLIFVIWLAASKRLPISDIAAP